jgi:hypothetical protein
MWMLGCSAIVDREDGHTGVRYIGRDRSIIEPNASTDHAATVKVNNGRHRVRTRRLRRCVPTTKDVLAIE